MITLWICLALTASISSNAYANSGEEDGFYDDYYLNDMDQGIFKPVGDIFKTTSPNLLMNPDNSKNVNDESEEIINYEDEKKFEEELDKYVKNRFVPKADDNFDDYQFEDNRSEVELDTSNESEGGDLIRPLSGVISQGDPKEENEDQQIDLPTDLTKMYENADKTILEETKSILDEDTINEFDSDKASNQNQINDDNSKIFEETSKILKESYLNEKTDKDYNNGGEELNSVSESIEDIVSKSVTSPEVSENSEGDDTVDKAFTDLISDFDKLHGVLKKFNDFDGNSQYYGSDENNQEMESSNDYEEIDDEELDKIFQSYVDEENGEDKPDEKLSDDKTKQTKPAKTHKVLPYIIDGLVSSDVKESLPATTVLPSVTTEEDSTNEATTLSQEQSIKTIVEENSLINKFIKEHPSVYDIKASDVRNAINIRLTRDAPVEVTSPNYPSMYPTNKVVDWMFTGDGVGIELNITDFSINGYLGDYLLVKPGGVDESGSTGIIFTYQLRTERRYRFLDVDKMFVRFFANPGNQFMRGFKFSARMVSRRPDALVEPEPEIPLPDPPATITINLGGISLQSFMDIEEEFRHIIADMATMYINAHEINPGLNTTLESTQITSRALCFHNWPQFELCTEVQFGVPIVYDDERNDTTENRLNEEDLLDMWTFYSQRDPFAVRLRQLGITEYQVPNDAGVLTLWLVVAGGVVVSAALLALALWRFSCFEDYSRMPIYSDTESIAEKRTLDLYPTPHQTLPPLYTETDYKWAHDFDADKVDMGFPNKSFLPDDAFEALGGSSGRDRNFSFSPREVYDV